MSIEILQTLERAFDFLVARLGPGPTVAIILGVIVALVVLKVFAHWAMVSGFKTAISEKERSIQRLADQERQWRVQHFKALGWDDKEIDRYFIRNSFESPQASRDHWERKAEKPAARRKRRK